MNYHQTTVARATIEVRRIILIQFQLPIGIVTASWQYLAKFLRGAIFTRCCCDAADALYWSPVATICNIRHIAVDIVHSMPPPDSKVRQSRIDHHGP